MKRKVVRIPVGKSPEWIRLALVGFKFDVQDRNPEDFNFHGPEDGDHIGEEGDFALWSDLEAFLLEQGERGREVIAYFKEIERKADKPIPFVFFLRAHTDPVD